MKTVESAVITDSPEFRRWFGQSKVVNADGSPQVVFHGTGKDFTRFHPKSWFTDNPQLAEEFYRGRQGRGRARGRTYAVYLRIEKPFVFPAGMDVHDSLTIHNFLALVGISWEEWAAYLMEHRMPGVRDYWRQHQGPDRDHDAPVLDQWGWTMFLDKRRPLNQEEKPFTVVDRGLQLQIYSFLETNDTLIQLLRERGYDGIETRETMRKTTGRTWMIFEPNQVKSAIANTGFDPANPHLNR